MATLNSAETLSALQKIQAASKTGARLMVVNDDQVNELPISVLADALASVLSVDALSAPDAVCMLGQVASFNDLRNLKPRSEGARVSLRGWNAGSCVGGGDFIGRLVTSTQPQKKDDGGVVAAGKGFYWERVLADPALLNVTHFGAVQGKTKDTDCVPAMLAMHNWTLANATGLGIQFPSGTFFVSRLSLPNQINFFRLAGNHVNFGYFTNTVLVTDQNPEFMIDVNSRWVELANIQFQGVSTVDKPNQKGIFNNVITGGQYFNGSCIRFSKIGGRCIKLVDTLDTKLNQWYASQCTGDVLVSTWSGRAAGNWDHSTAIELSNFNIQNCRLGKVFDLQRCTQSLMYNGWIEHCDNPGDISNGQWTLTALSIEDCKTSALKASYARVVETNRSLQSGSSIDYTPDPNLQEWLSEWERGRIDIQNHGLFVSGSTEPGSIMSRNKLSNSTDKAKWFRVGLWYSPAEGDSIDINLVGTGNYLSVGAPLDDIDGVRQGGGNTLIRVQMKKDATVGATFEPSGSSPVLKAKLTRTGRAGQFMIYVQLKPYTRNVIPVIVATGATHFEAGVSYYFRPDIAAMTDDEIAALTNSTDVVEQWSLGQVAGVGASNEGNLILKSKVVNNHLQVQVMVSTAQWAKPEIRYLELKKEAK